jgi:hypothetical protein
MKRDNGQILTGDGDSGDGEFAGDLYRGSGRDERLTFQINITRPRHGGFVVLDSAGDNEAAFGRYSELEDYVRAKMRNVLDAEPVVTTQQVAARFAPARPQQSMLGRIVSIGGGR